MGGSGCFILTPNAALGRELSSLTITGGDPLPEDVGLLDTLSKFGSTRIHNLLK
jgi:hypothetical protein